SRTPYPTDVSDDEWAFVAPYLTLLPEDAGQRTYSLREVFNGLRWIARAGARWRLMPNGLPPWWGVYPQTQRWLGAGCCAAFVDQAYTGDVPAAEAQQHGIQLAVVKLPEAKRGFVLLPRRWVVERSFAWTARFRRLVRDYERLPATLAGLHLIVFACLMLHQWTAFSSP